MKCSRCIAPFFLTTRVLGCSPKGAIKAQPSSSKAASLFRMVKCSIMVGVSDLVSARFVRDGVAECRYRRGGAVKSGVINLRVGHLQIGGLRIALRIRPGADGGLRAILLRRSGREGGLGLARHRIATFPAGGVGLEGRLQTRLGVRRRRPAESFVGFF